MPHRFPVHIVDDDAGLRNSLRFMLSKCGRTVRTFDSGEALLAEIDRLERGPILLDLRMQGMSGLDVQNELTRRGRSLPVVILTGHGDIATAVLAMRNGALDFLTKPYARADLLAALEQADLALESEVEKDKHRLGAKQQLEVLSPRELQVLNELARGLPNKSIGYDLGISQRTVEAHRAKIMKKLHKSNFPDALRIAFLAGMPFDHPVGGDETQEPRLPL